MAEESRRQILEATTEILARGVDELTMPAVARQAGVSVPTVYRNFPDKKALLGATLEHLKRERDYGGPPATLDELEGTLEREYAKATSLKESVRLALSSPQMMATAEEAGMREFRRGHMRQFLGPYLDQLGAREREHVLRLAVTMCSGTFMRAMAQNAGCEAKEAAASVAWAIKQLVGASKRRK